MSLKSFSFRPTFHGRLGLASAAVLCVALASTSVAISTQVRSALLSDAGRSLDGGMVMLKSMLAAKGGTDAVRSGPDGMTLGNFKVDGDTEVVDAVKAAIGGSATVFRDDMRVATSVTKADGSRGVGTRLAEGPARDAVVRDGVPYRGEAEILGTRYLTLYEPMRDASGARVGVLYVGLPKSSFLAFLDALYLEIAMATLVATVLGAVAMSWVAKRSVRPLGELMGVMTALRSGDLDVEVRGTERGDVIGSMAQSVDAFKAGLREREAMRVAAEGEAERAEAARKSEAARLASEIEAEVGSSVEALSRAAREMRAGAVAAVTIGGEARGKAVAVNEASQQTSTNVQLVAAASEEMVASIAEIAERTNRSAMATRRASDAMDEVEGAMLALDKAAATVDGVVATISSLASQTNLLALNATIEAARAGSAGRGFAVVASEVKALAKLSGDAARDVQAQISGMKATVEAAVASMGRTAGIVRDIDVDINSIAATVTEQGAATSEINGSMGLVAVGMQSLADNAGSMGTDVARSAEIAAEGEVLAGGVERMSRELEAGMGSLVARLRAA